MYKRILIFSLFMAVVVYISIKSIFLPIAAFIFYPFLVFPTIYFYLIPDARLFYYASNFVLFMLYGYLCVRYKSWEISFLAVTQIAFFFILNFYRNQRTTVLVEKKKNIEIATHELDQLTNKHHARLESLHHLEKQVAGLLDLFEIAKDFSEHLSLQGVCEIIQKKVLPEMPFSKMEFFVLHNNETIAGFEKFVITNEAITRNESVNSTEDLKRIQQFGINTKLIKDGAAWYFPLLSAGHLKAMVVVWEAQETDLAKFEVLTAYLALQIKKVELYNTVKELAIRDGLTGVFVRRHFTERFEEEIRRSQKYGISLSVLMLDIDHFKRYNDEHGHLAGDATLKHVAAILKDSLRQVDIIARFGGEEFVMILPETKREGALDVAERIRSNVARNEFKVFGQPSKVTVSIGVTQYPSSDLNENSKIAITDLALSLIAQADKALYRAKEEGRNRVVAYQDKK